MTEIFIFPGSSHLDTVCGNGSPSSQRVFRTFFARASPPSTTFCPYLRQGEFQPLFSQNSLINAYSWVYLSQRSSMSRLPERQTSAGFQYVSPRFTIPFSVLPGSQFPVLLSALRHCTFQVRTVANQLRLHLDEDLLSGT